MSIPLNPLDEYNTTAARHVLVAFKYTVDAEQTKITPLLGGPGDIITGTATKSPAIVIANEFSGSDFSIRNIQWTNDFYGPLTDTASSCIGYIQFADRTGLYFMDFLKTKATALLGVSEGHLVFALKTFFVGTNNSGQNNDILPTNPLIFNMVTMVNDLSPESGRLYTMSFVGSSTTFAQLNQFSKIYQMSITHADGNLFNVSPAPAIATCAMVSRQQDDTTQSAIRKKRIDKSKPMVTLQDVFTAFAGELNQQKYTNVAQLQTWLSYVNNDYAVKILPPVQTKKGGIPIDFVINLDPAYAAYPIDNRNLPFEQPEQDQTKSGIRCIPVKTATDIPVMIDKLMKYSRQVGKDAEASTPLTYKTSMSMIKTSADRYKVTVNINRINVPINGSTVNTGPGDAPVPLTFTYQDPLLVDRDIISIVSKEATDVAVTVLEQQTQDNSALVVYGDREQITVQRAPSTSFFQTQYSGLRAMINPYENYGLESGTDASKIDNNINVALKQKTEYSIVINGNPYLLADLNRLPSDVANGNVGNPHYYKFTEYDPMYVKLRIYLKPSVATGVQQNDDTNNRYYFDNYLFMFRVTNIFSVGQFTQKLDMLRQGDLI